MQNEKCSNKTLRICGVGSVRKNKGKWQAIVTVADEVTGKKVQRTRNTGVPCLKQGTRGKAAAMRVLSEFRSEIESEFAEAEGARAAVGTGLPAEKRDDYAALPLSEALEKFIDFCLEMNRITPTTRDDYHYSALHIERDELGLVPVNEVTTDDVNAWSRRRIALGTAPDTLNKSFKLGKRLYAVLLKRSNDTIGRNPFDGALAPRVIARPRNALRSDLVPKLNSVTSMMSDSTFRRAVVLALHTGMRIGEVCGLRWCDVDFESGLITVRHSVAYVKDRGSFIKDTKSHDLRTIPIDPVGLLPFLKEIHEIDTQRLREASTLGLRDLADSYVVSRPDGSFATTSYIRRAFKTFSETNGLMGTNDELITFHGLRHPYVKHTTKIFSLRSMAFQAQAYPDARRKTRGACQLHRGGQSQSPVHPLCNRKRFSYLPPQSKISRILYAISMRLSGYTSTRSISSSASSVVSASASKIALDASFRLSCRACSSCFCFACANTAA